MDPKNLEAMGRGREYMLARFVNLPLLGRVEQKYLEWPCVVDKETAAKSIGDFYEQFGKLIPRNSST